MRVVVIFLLFASACHAEGLLDMMPTGTVTKAAVVSLEGQTYDRRGDFHPSQVEVADLANHGFGNGSFDLQLDGESYTITHTTADVIFANKGSTLVVIYKLSKGAVISVCDRDMANCNADTKKMADMLKESGM